MSLKQMAAEAMSHIQSSGIEKVQVTFTRSEVHELEMQGQSINLCRTYFNDNYAAKAVSQKRQAKGSLNQWNDESRARLTQELKAGLEASPEDKAYTILDSKEQKSFLRPLRSPDLDGLLKSITQFLSWAKENHPQIQFESSPLKFVKTSQVLMNSHGLSLEACEDGYQGFIMFTGKDGKKTTSFNYIDFSSHDVPMKLQDVSGLSSVLELSTRELGELGTANSPKNIVLSPYVLPNFLGFFLSQISTSALMSGSSIFKGKLGEKILSEKISLFSQPTNSRFADLSPYTPDGILTENGSIFERGVLKSYLVDLYGSHKLDMKPTPFMGSHLTMSLGDKPFSELISGIDHGILLTRFSGGSPSANGDFSGVAKNSFLIENGKITRPIQETMISGNILQMFQQVEGVSRDQISFGSRDLPWVHARL